MRSETSFDINGDLIVVDAVVVGPTGRATIQLVLDTGSVRDDACTLSRRGDWIQRSCEHPADGDAHRCH